MVSQRTTDATKHNNYLQNRLKKLTLVRQKTAFKSKEVKEKKRKMNEFFCCLVFAFAIGIA